MEKFIEEFAEIIERDDKVNMEDDFRMYEEWNSLAILALLSLIDEEYGVNISSNQLEKMSTVKDIYNYITSNTSK